MRKVTEEEVNKLYDFTRKHYVEYYDLQTELVDHLANGMEERWEENPSLGFEENLRLEFKKFGVFGFMDVVEKRTSAMQKKYFKLIWAEVKLALKQPQTLVLVFLSLIVFKFIASVENAYFIFAALCVGFAIYIIGLTFRRQMGYSKKKKKNERVFLLEDMIRNAGGASVVFLIPYYAITFITSDSGEIGNVYLQWALSILATAMILLAYICFHILPKKKTQILKKAYPGMESSL
jgi:hypothetical protein